MTLILQRLKSRTVRFSLLLALLSVLQGYVGLLPLSQHGQMIAGLAIALAIWLLRELTTKPISDK